MKKNVLYILGISIILALGGCAPDDAIISHVTDNQDVSNEDNVSDNQVEDDNDNDNENEDDRHSDDNSSVSAGASFGSSEDDKENPDVSEDEDKKEPEEDPEPEPEPEPEPVDNSNLENMDAIMGYQATIDLLYQNADCYTKTENIFETSKLIINDSTYDFSQTTIVFMGDSITYGQGGTVMEDGHKFNYTDVVKEVLDCPNIVNVSQPGACMGTYGGSISIPFQVDHFPEDPDIIVVMGGVNDYIGYNDRYGVDFTTPNCYKNETMNFMEMLRTSYPDADIFFITTFKNREEGDVYIDHSIANVISLENFMNVQRELRGKYNINIIDMYNTGYLNNHDDMIYHEFFTDLLHPNDNGSRLIGKYVAGQIILHYYNEQNQ